MIMKVCVTGTHLYTQSRVYHSKSIKDHTTISTKDQISIFTHQIHRYQWKHTIQEVYGKKCKIYWERSKTYTFPWRLVKRWKRIWRCCVWTRWFWKNRKKTRGWIVSRCEGKMKSFWNQSRKRPLLCKHTTFAIEPSHVQVARACRENT